MTAGERAQAALQAASLDGAGMRPGPAAVVSPMCQAVDWSCWCVPDAGLFLKLREPDALPFVDLHATVQAMQAAAALGVSPAVRFVLPEQQAVGMDLLPPSWRTARLNDLARPEVLAAVLAAKRVFRDGPPLRRAWDIFAEVAAVDATIRNAGTAPPDMPELLAGVRQAHGALLAAGRDLRPCHADGLSSNIMIGPGGQVMLVDFDCAGMADPHYDVGVVLNEACQFETEMQPGLELAFGRDDARDLNRCRLHAFADDVFWGLWGLAMAATSPRRGLEFLKYGEWRLLRARMFQQDGAFAARLHRL